MSKPRAISATFADWRTVKGRKVLQLVFEVPIEAQAEVLTLLGAPVPDKTTWCAIAVMAGQASPPAAEMIEDVVKGRRKMNELPLPQQAALLCERPAFWRFLGEHGWICHDEAASAEILRQICKVTSRAELKSGTDAAARFWKLQGDFDVWMRVAA